MVKIINSVLIHWPNTAGLFVTNVIIPLFQNIEDHSSAPDHNYLSARSGTIVRYIRPQNYHQRFKLVLLLQ